MHAWLSHIPGPKGPVTWLKSISIHPCVNYEISVYPACSIMAAMAWLLCSPRWREAHRLWLGCCETVNAWVVRNQLRGAGGGSCHTVLHHHSAGRVMSVSIGGLWKTKAEESLALEKASVWFVMQCVHYVTIWNRVYVEENFPVSEVA